MKTEKPIFLSGLNGLRTIAAIGVLFSHVNLALSNFGIHNYSLFGFDNGKQKSWLLGEHGVTIFFVLSGFLITFLLLKEFQKTRTIKIKEFYIRRLLRIWPLYYLYITLVLIFTYTTININENIFYYLTFFANVPFIKGTAYPAMDHLWSISVEEQFYLFWPFLFLFFVKKNFIKNILLIITLLSTIRILLWFLIPFSIPALISVVNRFDCMMIGALGAYLFYKKSFIINMIDNKFIQLGAWLVVILLIINKLSFFNSIIEIFLIELITVIIIIGQINKVNRIVNLENKLMSYLGKLSFGIYVYHPLLLVLFSDIFKNNITLTDENELVYFVGIFTFSITLTIIISHISYYYFEIKFLKIKEKFSIIKSSNVKI